uniref:Uncharacterized protein n=1 Tax=Arundo donax TaxID=35708 RepID=A0A0A9CT77_ARUDO
MTQSACYCSGSDIEPSLKYLLETLALWE